MDLFVPAIPAGLSRQIDARIDAHAEAAFGFLERLISAPSTVGQEGPALEIVAAELEALGFDIERLPIPDDIADVPGAGVPMLPYEGRYDVVSRRSGEVDGTSILLNGHIEVVPADEPQLWSSPPFKA